MTRFDYIVIGSGIAGLSFALKAAENGRVAIVTKRARSDSNTAWAQGGIASVTSTEDSFGLHVSDTLEAGAGLCDEACVRQIVAEGPERILELIRFGVQFDERQLPDGTHELDLAREGGHSKRRILHTRDITGREIERALLSAIEESPQITVFENHMAVDLITVGKLGFATADRCLGAYVLNEATGKVSTLRSDRVVLATGGCGKVYLYTTNPSIATGDGVAMAWRAGADIANMEFIQFHPTCLFHPEARSFLISEAIRGEGGRLTDSSGHPFMEKYHPSKELAPRDIVARAIDAEMKRTGARCVYLDISHQPAEFILERFPHIYENCLRFGIDITTQPIPVVPAAHYQCGGVQTDVANRMHPGLRCARNPPAFAVPACACSGCSKTLGDVVNQDHGALPKVGSRGRTKASGRGIDWAQLASIASALALSGAWIKAVNTLRMQAWDKTPCPACCTTTWRAKGPSACCTRCAWRGGVTGSRPPLSNKLACCVAGIW